ncbi:MAG: hypothetical protein ACRDOB_18685 [Streptosporangiaceae bacterium]
MLATVVALAACGTAAAPHPKDPHPKDPHPRDPRATAMPPGPPAGSRAEATALGGLLLSRLRLPPGTLPRPAEPVPQSLSEPGCAGCIVYADVHRLFAVAEPVASVVATLSAHAPAGLGPPDAGQVSSSATGLLQEISYPVMSVPAGIAWAQVLVSVAPGASGASLLRADAFVIWYPARTAAEYVDPDRYHVLTITATSYGRETRTVRAVVTLQAVITRLAEALDRSQTWPPEALMCPVAPAGLWSYQLAFSVSRHSRPDVMVSDTWCSGLGITVDGQPQPSLGDVDAVAAIAGQALHLTSRP